MSQHNKPEMVEGKSQIEKKIIHAKAGESFKIRLWEDRTRGSRWTPIFDGASIRLLGDTYERTRNIRVSDIGMHYFEFVVLNPGTYEIVFESRYGWKFTAEGRLVYEVEVSG